MYKTHVFQHVDMRKIFFGEIVYRPLLTAISVWIPGWSLGPFGVDFPPEIVFRVFFRHFKKTTYDVFSGVNGAKNAQKSTFFRTLKIPDFQKNFVENPGARNSARARAH